MGNSRRRVVPTRTRDDDGAANAVGPTATPQPSLAVQQLAAQQRGPAPPTSLRSMQGLAGNAATGALVQRLTVQRDLVENTERVGGAIDPFAPAINQGAAASNLGNAWNRSTDSVAGSNETGVVGSSISTPLAAAGMVTSSIGHHRARKDLAGAAQGTADEAEARRRVNVTGGNVAQNTAKTGSGIADITAGSMQVAGHTAGQLASGIASFITVPLNIFQSIREGIRAEKARQRVVALDAVLNDWETKPEEALSTAQNGVVAAQQYVDEMAALVAKAESERAQQQIVARNLKQPFDAKKWDDAIEEAKRAKQAAETKLSQARTTYNDALQAKQAMQEAVKRAATTGEPTLEDIANYAKIKNYAGHIKKALSSAGAALGAAGGIVLGVAATAGTAALMATPFGWALASLAAAAGIGLASYKAWKFFSKRWRNTKVDATGQKRTFGAHLKETLSFWKSTGPSKRDRYAEQLYKLTKNPGPRQEEAKKLVAALGLDPAVIVRGTDTKAIALIAAKLAS